MDDKIHELITETLQYSGHNVPWATRARMVIRVLEEAGFKIIEVEKKEQYTQGWNARCKNESFTHNSTFSWQDGWQACDKKRPEDRIEII